MDLNKLLNNYGWVNVNQIHTENFRLFIHPDDLGKLEKNKLSDFVFKCLQLCDDGYIEVEPTEIRLKLLEQTYRLMPKAPKFIPKEKIKYRTSKGVLEYGAVVAIDWHNKDHKHIYFIEVNGKRKSKRYSEDDLEKVVVS